MNQKVKPFQITRVVTRNIATDSFQGIRNTFGLRLRGYEKMISQTIEEVQAEAKIKYEVVWWRLSINPLGNKSCMITLYGEAKDE
jgi:uncharacterized protein YbjQ (UPF0145 family)